MNEKPDENCCFLKACPVCGSNQLKNIVAFEVQGDAILKVLNSCQCLGCLTTFTENNHARK
jgi:hypothetical protein